MGSHSPQRKKKQQQQTTTSNVRVVARIRPLAKYEIENGSKRIVTSLSLPGGGDDDDIKISTEPEILQVLQPSSSTEKRWFELDAVLDGNSTQKMAYIKSGAQQAVTQDIFKGFNCTILAYGQTGSGKTFTMGSANAAGTSSDDIGELDGIIPRACADLFHQIQSRCDGNAQVELSYLEIYNEEMRDLLSADNDKTKSNSNNKSTTELKIRETLNGEVYVGGLSSRPVSSPKEIGEFMEVASQRRAVASTKMNAVSSRSHAICVLRIKGVLEDSTKFQAKLTLVDLAGSERLKKTGAEGGRRQEGININKGLFVLGQVVSALSETRPKYKRKPPYRDSKLTRLLQDSLGGNSRTIMVACVSPADFNLDETITTLRYATNARNIKNTATRNVIKSLSPEEAAKLQRENQLLVAQVKELQETIREMAAVDEGIGSGESTGITSSSSTDNDSLSSSEEGDRSGGNNSGDAGEITMSQQKERVKELEQEVRKLKMMPSSSSSPPSKSSSQRMITRSMAQDAIELPDLKKRIATLEEEIMAKEEVEIENIELQEEMQNLRADADSALLAANKMSKIMEQLQELKGDEIDKKKMEHDHIKVEEAWVSFVFQVLQTNNEHLKKLQDDFEAVSHLVESSDFMGVEEGKTGFMSNIKRRIASRRIGTGANGSAAGAGAGVRPTTNSNREQKQQNESDSQQMNREDNAQSSIIQRSNNSDTTDETKQQQQQQQDDPTHIMKVIVNLKDELKAAHEVIRQQRVQVECSIMQKKEQNDETNNNNSSTDNDDEQQKQVSSLSPVATGMPADSPTVPVSEYQKLKAKYTQMEIDRCWGEFQLRDRITNDALKFHRRIRDVMHKKGKTANDSGSSGGSLSSMSRHGVVQDDNTAAEHQQKQKREEEIIKTKVNTELRQRLKTVAEHLHIFEGRMVEMENHVSAEMDSLESIRDSLRVQQDQMELEIGTSEIERGMLDKDNDDDNDDLLEQLTSLLVGPVKNLGSYPPDEQELELL